MMTATWTQSGPTGRHSKDSFRVSATSNGGPDRDEEPLSSAESALPQLCVQFAVPYAGGLLCSRFLSETV